jgi:hypothetical protein
LAVKKMMLCLQQPKIKSLDARQAIAPHRH